MKFKIGQSYLITTNNWFFAPDGEMYRGVFGKLKAIHSDQKTLGIRTNHRSTNWYAEIGNVIVAGCQIFYAVQTEKVKKSAPTREIVHNGDLFFKKEERTKIYFAD